eukprot:Cvel_15111.t1-p1 / transcript=Cvel_15111.t1 / gene=Cvel_15111 / organism=Chromera_velia_CCMP2878 / gene_product=hypothetical protein / transcript_product=hypothetical protein / location=Cvel_scaffold1102:54702-56158(+) / protein_length=317 / sequence_SO=supercontig / SO=protein_coding / is_pseudo=false
MWRLSCFFAQWVAVCSGHVLLRSPTSPAQTLLSADDSLTQPSTPPEFVPSPPPTLAPATPPSPPPTIAPATPPSPPPAIAPPTAPSSPPDFAPPGSAVSPSPPAGTPPSASPTDPPTEKVGGACPGAKPEILPPEGAEHMWPPPRNVTFKKAALPSGLRVGDWPQEDVDEWALEHMSDKDILKFIDLKLNELEKRIPGLPDGKAITKLSSELKSGAVRRALITTFANGILQIANVIRSGGDGNEIAKGIFSSVFGMVQDISGALAAVPGVQWLALGLNLVSSLVSFFTGGGPAPPPPLTEEVLERVFRKQLWDFVAE